MKKVQLFFWLLTMFVIAVSVIDFPKHEEQQQKEYRRYTITNYTGFRSMVPIQVALGVFFRDHPEYKDITVNDVIPLHKLQDPRGESWSRTKEGPLVYLRTTINMPINFMTATQVFSAGGTSYHREYDVHIFVKEYPAISSVIKNALKNPCKYMVDSNKDAFISYMSQMIEYSGGQEMLDKYGFNTLGKNYLQGLSRKFDVHRSYFKLNDGKCSVKKMGNDDFHNQSFVLRYVDNQGEVINSEVFKLEQ